MRTCQACNFVEKNDSSSFCSNCGKPFEEVTSLGSIPKKRSNPSGSSEIERILAYFVILSLGLNLLMGLFTNISTLFILSLILTAVLFLAFIRVRYSYVFSENKQVDEFEEESVKIRPPTWHH